MTCIEIIGDEIGLVELPFFIAYDRAVGYKPQCGDGVVDSEIGSEEEAFAVVDVALPKQ